MVCSYEQRPAVYHWPDPGSDHGADMVRYASMAAKMGLLKGGTGMTAAQAKEIWNKHKG